MTKAYSIQDGEGDLAALGDVSLTLGVIYLCTSVLIVQRVPAAFHNSRSGLDTKKLFVLSVLVTCLLRTASFVGIGTVAYKSEELNDDSTSADDGDGNRQLYRMTILVMFDLPDFIILSAYMLLGLVWGETLLRSRKHWYSLRDNRRPWLLAYLVINLLLYCTQLLLYSLLFVDAGHVDTSKIVYMLYVTLCSVNYGLPLMFGLFWLYWTLKFSGFPYTSPRARLRMQKIGRAMFVWSISRVVWAACILTATLQTALRGFGRVFTVVFVVVFLLCEIWPIMIALEKDLLYMLMEVSEVSEQPSAEHHEERFPSIADSEMENSTVQYTGFLAPQYLHSPDESERGSNTTLV